MINITIDGVAGCGKSSIAKGLADRFNFKEFNTGAIYRALTCEFINKYGKDACPNEKLIDEFLKNVFVKVVFKDKNQLVFVNDKDYTPYLREEIISVTTPKISGYEHLREKVRSIQREFARHNDCVMEGRDIGRVVLPNAICKFFFTASSQVRAKRRLLQLEQAGESATYEELLEDIIKRDEQDKNREHGAMIPAKDSIIIDNSFETYEQTLNRCVQIVREKISK